MFNVRKQRKLRVASHGPVVYGRRNLRRKHDCFVQKMSQESNQLSHEPVKELIPIIYLDSAAYSKPLQCALEAYRNAPFGNPSSSHAVGQAAREALENARERIAKCIGADKDEIYFTSGSTESCNIAMNTLVQMCESVFRSPYEHHAVHENFNSAIIKNYYLIVHGDTAQFERGYAQMLVCNETGEIFDMPNRVNPTDFIFSDLTAAVGHFPVNVKQFGIDYGAFSGHKFGGVLGAGVLYVQKHCPHVYMISGGGQERGMRAGTENVPAICAMAAALEWHTERMEQETAYIAHLRDLFLDCLDNSGIAFTVNTPLDKCIPHILNVSFPGCEGTALSLLMSERGVMCSAGAACSNGLNEPSHVLMAMFNDEARARSALRFSFSHDNKDMEIIKSVMILAEEVKKLSALSAH